MERLPGDINRQLILTLNYEDILNLCKTDKNWRKVCQQEETWKLLFNRDFPGIPQTTNFHFRYQYFYDKVNRTTNDIMKKYKFTENRYTNTKNMKDDIFQLIKDFIVKHIQTKRYIHDDEMELRYDIVKILSALNDKYFDKFDEVIDTLNPLDILLRDLGIREKDESEYGDSENEDEEDESEEEDN